MAVTDMQKLTVIGLNSSRTPFLHELMRLGVVEINSQEGVVNDEEWMPDICLLYTSPSPRDRG